MRRLPVLVGLLLACGEKEGAGEPCETSADCDTGERCWGETNEAGADLGTRCGVCEIEGGELDGHPTCLELEDS